MSRQGARENERGFTLVEVMVTIVIMGIVFAIASSTWFSVAEGRRVDSATNQLVSDLRLAHTRATNQLAGWRVVLNADRGPVSAGADYSLVKLDSAGNPVPATEVPYTLPDDALLNSPTLVASGGTQAVNFAADSSASVVGTVNLGAAATDGCPASTPASGPRIRVTVDNNPMHCVTFNTVTSRIKVD
jgi:prepilin-type N-terminal cleavage/methylation domain-containing protein